MRVPSNNILLNQSLSYRRLSALQSQVDGLVEGFTEKATDGRSLASMVAGGMAYRTARIGVMGLGGGNVLRAVSVGLGLCAEVSTFEITHRGLSAISRHPENPNLWQWNGSGSLRQGLLQSFITFGTLKGAGRLARGENFILQHLAQDSAMVAGHQISWALQIAPRPPGTLAEQFLHAEATNLQIGAGLALAHRFSRGLNALERGLDLMAPSPLSLSLEGEGDRRSGEGELTRRFIPAFALGLGDLQSRRPESPERDPKREGLYFSKMFKGSQDSRRSLERGLGPETPLEKRLREGPAVPVKEVPAAIRQLLQEIPPPFSHLQIDPTVDDFPPSMIVAGRLRYRRLEALHRLLLGDKDPKDTLAVDNAPGHFAETFITLARMGSRVAVKDPGDLFVCTLDMLDSLKVPDLLKGISFYNDLSQIDRPTPADVVYWTHPALHNLQWPAETSLGNYLGRDVKPGGYLVIQSDHLLGTHKKLLQLNLNPQEWETIYHASLPNNILPTIQTVDLHLQVHRRKEAPFVHPSPEKTERVSVVSPSEANEPEREALEFPYVQGEDGIFFPRQVGGTVAVLGEMSGKRLFQLAARGHPVIYMDYDPDYLMATETNVGIFAESARMSRRLSRPLNISFLASNWYDTRVEADWVEAFYPWDYRDLPLDPGPQRYQALRFFLENAIHTKLKPGKGGAFIVSEHWEAIDDLAQVIAADPRLELLETVSQQRRPLIAGGYGFAPSPNMLSSWLIYRRK